MLIRKQPRGQTESFGSTGRFPVPFIVGAGRSGTTLLRLMLDAHPELAMPLETHFIPDAAARCPASPDPRQAFLDTLRGYRKWGGFLLDDQAFGQEIARLQPFDLGEALRIFYHMYARRFGKWRWGDKTPEYVGNMRLIQELLPEVRFIHLVRDGRDVALSIKDLSFGPNTVAAAAQWWVVQMLQARTQVVDIDYYLEIRYEDLITNTAATLQEVCEFIDLSLDPAMFSYYERSEERLSEFWAAPSPRDDPRLLEAEKTNIQVLTTRPPQTDRIGVWRREMGPADRETFDEVAGDVLQEFGYALAEDD